MLCFVFFFIQSEDGIRDLVRSRGLGDVYKRQDNEEDVNYLVQKISTMRIFGDEEGKMNLSMKDIKADALVISQFTLFAMTKKGNRPSFIKAARPEKANILYEYFCTQMSQNIGKKVEKGVFGADMKVELINDGPVTIIIDSQNKDA